MANITIGDLFSSSESYLDSLRDISEAELNITGGGKYKKGGSKSSGSKSSKSKSSKSKSKSGSKSRSGSGKHCYYYYCYC